MYLVTKGKRKENQLGYAPKTQEYVYFHYGKEIWREKGDTSLLDYFNEVRANIRMFNDEDIKDNPIWKKYGDSCLEFDKAIFIKDYFIFHTIYNYILQI